MKIIDLLTSPWAIVPDKLSEMQNIYAVHMRGEKIDIKGIEAKLGKPLVNGEQGYEVTNGVAIIPIEGVIAKKMNLFSDISGGASSELITRDIKNALNDPEVKAIILSIDSPGGSVDGTQNLANVVSEAAKKKPVVALANGVMASAAYWIGSAANEIYITDETTQVGSIGVVAKHTDVSGAEEKNGIKTTEIYAGKYKRIASQYAPLTDEGKASMQDFVDQIYSVFVNDVARFRGVDSETVLEKMADGRVFIGRQAIDAGLVDGVSTMEDLIAKLALGGVSNANPIGAGDALSETTISIEKGNEMDIQTIAKDHPEIAEALRKQGADAERQRIQDVEKACLPGHEKLIAELKFDGKTSGAEAAQKVVNAERDKNGNRLKKIETESSEIVPHATNNDVNATAEDPTLSAEDRAKAEWEKDPKVRDAFATSEDYVAYKKAVANKQVKVLSGRSVQASA